MNHANFESKRRSVATPSGRISYVEHGAGPVALFVHGVLAERLPLAPPARGLGDVRRCIAVDLLAHGADRDRAGAGRVVDGERDDAGAVPRRARHRSGRPGRQRQRRRHRAHLRRAPSGARAHA